MVTVITCKLSCEFVAEFKKVVKESFEVGAEIYSVCKTDKSKTVQCKKRVVCLSLGLFLSASCWRNSPDEKEVVKDNELFLGYPCTIV